VLRVIPLYIFRFIPTGVGNILIVSMYAPVSSVHPHRRGEHLAASKLPGAPAGSSPQAWGTSLQFLEPFPEMRFIPTGVGNITVQPVISSGPTVHPHRRGEHKMKGVTIGGETGSSPQAWGTCHCYALLSKELRFIPTGVGNIRPTDGLHAAQAVHPHRRGEHVSPPLSGIHPAGSSPQAWGT